MASARNPYFIHENFTSTSTSTSKFTDTEKDILDKSIDLADDLLKNLENKRIHIQQPKSHKQMEQSLMQIQKSIGNIMQRFSNTSIVDMTKHLRIPQKIGDIRRLKLPSEKIHENERNLT
jgi:dsDNA-binding SOS-regulon protein